MRCRTYALMGLLLLMSIGGCALIEARDQADALRAQVDHAERLLWVLEAERDLAEQRAAAAEPGSPEHVAATQAASKADVGIKATEQWKQDAARRLQELEAKLASATSDAEAYGSVAAGVASLVPGWGPLISAVIALGVGIFCRILGRREMQAKADAVVRSIDVARIASGRGLVDFSDPKIIEILDKVQGAGGKRLVDAAQGK